MALLSWLYHGTNKSNDKKNDNGVSSDHIDEQDNISSSHDDIIFDTDTTDQDIKMTRKSNKKQTKKITKTTTITTTITPPTIIESQSQYSTDITRSLKGINYLSLDRDNSNCPIEVLLSFDTTGRMYNYFKEFTSNIATTLDSLFQTVPLLKLAFIVHGDYCDDVLHKNDSNLLINTRHNRTIATLSFTNDRVEIIKWLAKVEKTDGGDAPEAYELVLHKSRQLPWSENAKKAIILFGDDVPHPPSYTDQHYYWRNELYYLTKIGIRVYGVQCQNNKHAQLFYEELAGLSGGRYIHLKEPTYIGQLFVLLCLRENGRDRLQHYINQHPDNEKFTQLFPALWAGGFLRERETINVRFSWWDISNDLDPNPRYLLNDVTDTFELNESSNYVIPPPSTFASSRALVYGTPLSQQVGYSSLYPASAYLSPTSSTPTHSSASSSSIYSSPMTGYNNPNFSGIYLSPFYPNQPQPQPQQQQHSQQLPYHHPSLNSTLNIPPPLLQSPQSMQSPFSIATHLPTASKLNFASKQAKIGVTNSKKRKSYDGTGHDEEGLKNHYHPYDRSSLLSSPPPSSSTPSELIWLEKPIPPSSSSSSTTSPIPKFTTNNNLSPLKNNQELFVNRDNIQLNHHHHHQPPQQSRESSETTTPSSSISTSSESLEPSIKLMSSTSKHSSSSSSTHSFLPPIHNGFVAISSTNVDILVGKLISHEEQQSKQQSSKQFQSEMDIV